MMAYDEELVERIRSAVGTLPTTDRKMFGGVAFMLDGRMFCGVIGDQLVVRVGPERNAEALRQPHVRPMDFTGGPMKGYVYVAPAGLRSDTSLQSWLDRAAEFVSSLPKKQQGVAKPVRRAKPLRGIRRR